MTLRCLGLQACWIAHLRTRSYCKLAWILSRMRQTSAAIQSEALRLHQADSELSQTNPEFRSFAFVLHFLQRYLIHVHF